MNQSSNDKGNPDGGASESEYFEQRRIETQPRNNSSNVTDRAIATAIALASEHQRAQHIPHVYPYNNTQSHQSTNFSSIINHRQLAATLTAQERLLQQLEGILQHQFSPSLQLLPPQAYARYTSSESTPMSQFHQEPFLSQQFSNIGNTVSMPLEQVAAYFYTSQTTKEKKNEKLNAAETPTTIATLTSETATLATLSSVTDTPSNIRQNKAASASASAFSSSNSPSLPSNTSNATPIKPKRPLSAYNFFFQQERAKIILQKQQVQDSCNKSPSTTTTTTTTTISHKKKRYRKDSTGFEGLAKEISQRWKNVDKDRLFECTRLAQADMQRYQADLAEYNKLKDKELSALQQAQVASVSEEAWEKYLTSAGAAAESQKSSRKRRRNDTNNDEE